MGRATGYNIVSPDPELLGTGLATYPTVQTTWPCDPTLLARTMEEALALARLTDWPERAIVSLTHPELGHRTISAQLDLADEPMTIRARDLQRLHAQAITQTLELDREAFLLEPLGYAGNGFESVSDPKGLAATRLRGMFQFITVPLAVKRAVLRALEIVGLELDRMVCGLQASAVACIPPSQWSRRVLLMDIGGCCTDLAMFDRGRLAKTTSLPWGGMIVADAIAKRGRMTAEQALSASLAGPSSPNPLVRAIFEEQLRLLESPIHQLLEDAVLPDAAVVTGRGACLDGMVEWVGRVSGLSAKLGRSQLAKDCGNLTRQVALSPALGLLQLSARLSAPSPDGASARLGIHGSERLVDRLLDRARHVLVEYF